MKYIWLFMFLFINTQLCYAFDYKNACHYLDNISGLKTSEYKFDGYQDYYCCSPYKMLDNKSNIAYYTEGNKNIVKKVYLVLNVYNGSNKEKLHNQLIQASQMLSKKSINYTLPQSIINNLKIGKNGIWKHGEYTISVKREDFPNGNGYEIHFKIEE